jgi:hypothetical protein
MESKKTYVNIPNRGEFELNYLVETIVYLRQTNWTFKKWKASAALIEKSGGSSRPYIGQKFDNAYFDLILNEWTHDHCEICFTTISGNKNLGEIDGFETNNREWICKQCYNLFISAKIIDTVIKSLKTVTK